MKILIVNPPHPAIGSRIPDDHLPPLGLLNIGGPLLDAGHDVSLLDCEFGPMEFAEIISQNRGKRTGVIVAWAFGVNLRASNSV